MKDMYSPTGWENAVDCGNTLGSEYPCTLKKTAPATQQAVDGSTRWFTVVYKDISPGDEARLLGEHPKASAMSWSHAMRDRDAARASAESVNQNNLESLLELIDNFAETRHTCGHWTYNLKSNEARQKVIAALKGNDLS